MNRKSLNRRARLTAWRLIDRATNYAEALAERADNAVGRFDIKAKRFVAPELNNNICTVQVKQLSCGTCKCDEPDVDMRPCGQTQPLSHAAQWLANNSPQATGE